MKKLAILLIGLTFTAASCNLDFFGPTTSGTKGVFRSGDGGQSYHPSNTITNKQSIDNLTINALIFDPFDPRIIYAGAPQGVYKSEDGGTRWEFILTGIRVMDLVADPFVQGVIYATGISGVNGKILKTIDNGTSWLDVFTEPNNGNLVNSITIAPGNNKLLLAGLNSGEVIQSTDEGVTWKTGENFADRLVRIRFGSNSTVFALTQRKGLYVSTNQGQEWSHKTKELTSTSLFTPTKTTPSISLFYDIAFSENKTQTIFLGTEQGLLMTQDGGGLWQLVDLPAKTSARKVLAVAVNSSNSSNVFTSIGSTMFKSVNNGLTWETNKLGTGRPVTSIIVNPKVENVIYLGMGE
jgi:photosystem II stability/assembly factor-like uncharacterized protein